MKLVSFLLRIAAISGAAFFLGLAFDAPALVYFVLTVVASILLIAAFDYTPARAATRSKVPYGLTRRRYTLPLAA